MRWRAVKSLIGYGSLSCVLLAGACTLGCGEPPPPPPYRSGDFVLGVTPFIPEAEASAVRNALFRIVLEKIPSGSHVTIFDGYRLRRITDFRIPPGKAYDRLKIRSKNLARNLREIQGFLNASAPAEAGVEGRIQMPQLLDLVAGSRPDNPAPLTVVLLGGALYLDPQDGRFSMAGGRYPSDDHLCVSREESVFGIADRGGRLQGARVHYGYWGNPWISGLHEAPVRRFWNLFFAEQGAELVTFAGDLPTVVDRMSVLDVHAPELDELQCPAQPKLGMIAVQRPLPGELLWLQGETTSCPESGPLQTRGPLKIGIRWRCLDCDLDLYSRPIAGASELFYGNPRTAEGVYFKDFLKSPTPSNAFEWIEYLQPVDLAGIEAAVNFYGGRSPGGVAGEVRIQTKDGTCGGSFRIKAAEGNRGEEGDDRLKSSHWAVLDIGRVVGLGKDRRPAEGDVTSVSPRLPEMAPARLDDEPPPAVPVTDGGEQRRTSQARGVRILTPRDGSTIRGSDEPGPVPHPVAGDVFGFSQADIRKFGLTVEVSIFTTGDFPQGIAEVREDGTWRLPTAWFGGSRHSMRAVLRDDNGNEIDSDEITVTVVH
jgi:hypothetical protein